tara:strand:- start:1135 stop:1557 length:423 start_codon:yes stop_codon:yes gene_type:complete
MKQAVNLEKTIAKLKSKVDMAVELAVKDRLEKIADFTINLSLPTVDTGAYITSFSYGVGAGRPRGKTSEGRPKGQDKVAMATEGLNNLLNDINSIQDFNYKDTIVLRNGSPHAKDVEDGGPDWIRTKPYKIFEAVRNKYG